MAFSVNTNAGALFALQSLTKTNRSLDTVQGRINTGLKVASAKDNAAIFSIAQKQRGELAGLESVKGSLDRAATSVNVALAAAEAVSDLLNQLKEKGTAAVDPGADAQARTALNDEFQELVAQINTITANAEFNGVNAVKAGGQAIVAARGQEDVQGLIDINKNIMEGLAAQARNNVSDTTGAQPPSSTNYTV